MDTIEFLLYAIVITGIAIVLISIYLIGKKPMKSTKNFEEPEKREAKLFDCRNGNTGFYTGYTGFENGPSKDQIEITENAVFTFSREYKNSGIAFLLVIFPSPKQQPGNYWVFRQNLCNGCYSGWHIVEQKHFLSISDDRAIVNLDEIGVSGIYKFPVEESNLPSNFDFVDRKEIYDAAGNMIGQRCTNDLGRLFVRIVRKSGSWTDWKEFL